MKYNKNLYTMIDERKLYDLRDITIVPKELTNITSRSQCNPFTKSLTGLDNYFPIITAPMDTVVDESNYKIFNNNGISTIIPRTVDISKRLVLCKFTFCAFSLLEVDTYFIQNPVNYEKLNILIDIANGHMNKQIEYGKKLREIYSTRLNLMGGNIANPYSTRNYDYIFDYVRLGIAGGSACLTGTQTGVYYPMASLIDDIVKFRMMSATVPLGKTKLIADGGINSYSDIIKCLALGADYVMLGSVLAKSYEAAGNIFDNLGNLIDQTKTPYAHLKGITCTKQYYGMSTKQAQRKIHQASIADSPFVEKTSEGKIRSISIEYDLKGWTSNLEHYIKSSMSYCDSLTLENFKTNTECRVISDSSSSKINNK